MLNRNFEHALRTGDLPMALAAAKELPAMTLERAARLLWLMGKRESPLYPKAAARFMSRYVAETKDLTPAMIADVGSWLAEVEFGDVDSAERLLAAVRRP